MSKRLRVYDGHQAVLLRDKQADELLSLCRVLRKKYAASFNRVQAFRESSRLHPIAPTPRQGEEHSLYIIAGELMLALIEAREA